MSCRLIYNKSMVGLSSSDLGIMKRALACISDALMRAWHGRARCRRLEVQYSIEDQENKTGNSNFSFGIRM